MSGELDRRFARRVRELAAERGITLAELAGQSGISEARLHTYMDGQESPDLDDVQAIAGVLGLEAAELVRPVRIPD